jgi:hypothetical protein
MNTAPYRTSAKTSATHTKHVNGDLSSVFGIVWLVSLSRVGIAFAHRESFGVEATLAVIALVLLSWHAVTAFRQSRRAAMDDESII